MSVPPAEFKQALGRFLSGVTVVVVEGEGGPIGMTASAFLSVSLEPPLVLVSVGTGARIHAPMLQGAAWSATILATGQEALSNHFAGYGPAEVAWVREPGVPPRLAGGLGWVQCTAFAAHEAGDHTLFVGRVEACGFGEGEPLTYFRGKYRALQP